MHSRHTSLKQEFLEKWAMGLKVCNESKKMMNLLERKKAIKLSADMAMASARKGRTRWSRALISNASKDQKNNKLLHHLLGNTSATTNDSLHVLRKEGSNLCTPRKMVSSRNRKMLRRKTKQTAKGAHARAIAKILVNKRTKVLKGLVPGGESMDEFNLMEEALDYIVSLRAQVDVMRLIANASEHLKGN